MQIVFDAAGGSIFWRQPVLVEILSLRCLSGEHLLFDDVPHAVCEASDERLVMIARVKRMDSLELHQLTPLHSLSWHQQ